jgi:hypothetical protein
MREKAIHLNKMYIEMVDIFIYLVSIINTNNDKIMEIKGRILMANTDYFSMINLFKSRTIHKKIRIYKTIVHPLLCYRCETWTMFSKVQEMLDAFDRTRFRCIYGPIKNDKG